MRITDTAPDTASTSTRRRRPRLWVAPLSLGVAGLLAIGVGVAVDASALHQPSGSWGYGFVGFVLVWYGLLPWLLTLLTSLLGWVCGDSPARSAWAMAGAGITAACGAALVFFTVLMYSPEPAGQVHAVAMAVTGACLVAQLVPSLDL